MPKSNGTIHDLIGPARGRLLHALRAGPDEGLHLRELARGTGLSLSSVQRELARMSTLGMLNRRSVGNRVLFKLMRSDAFTKLLQSGASRLEKYAAWYQKYRPDFARLLAIIDRERRTHARADVQADDH
jgi:predicted transcriptional regulator